MGKILDYYLWDLCDVAEEFGEPVDAFIEAEVSRMRTVASNFGVIVGKYEPPVSGKDPHVKIVFPNRESYVNFWTDDQMSYGGPGQDVNEMYEDYERLPNL